jgi:hypothetical protein
MLEDFRNGTLSAAVCQDQPTKVSVCLIVSAFARPRVHQQDDDAQTVPIVISDPAWLGHVDQCGMQIQRTGEAHTARHGMSKYPVDV